MKDESNIQNLPKGKRGPKPIGERPLTPSERKKRSRENLAIKGDAEFMVRLDRGTVNILDQIADANEINRSQLIAGLLDMALAKLALAIAEVEALKENGASEHEVSERLRTHLGATPPMGLLEKYKVVRGL